jgi:hypothetical protein
VQSETNGRQAPVRFSFRLFGSVRCTPTRGGAPEGLGTCLFVCLLAHRRKALAHRHLLHEDEPRVPPACG